jgi:hypothetical protein
MTRRHSSAPAPRDESGTRTSPVVMNTDAMMPDTLKFPNGWCCNLHADNLKLMQRAAKELGYEIEAGAPRNTDPDRFYGIYTNTNVNDPKKLLQHFFTLLFERSGASHHENANQHQPKRRKYARRRTA